MFDDQDDKRTEMEKEFYQPSTWQPQKAGKEIEDLIQSIQDNFDKWKPPRIIRDNLTNRERKVLKNIQQDPDITYKWEDKGPSFTKMTTSQYVKAGEEELENEKFYRKVDSSNFEGVKERCDLLVNDMLAREEISESVARFLLGGSNNVSNFYHLLKTHKIPPEVDNPEEWLHDNGYPLRGIISGKGGPTERLASFVDFFLQPGMKQLPSFLQNTKHVLQIVDELNCKIDKAEFSLEGVALVTLDVEAMYNNMSEELAGNATKEYLVNDRGLAGSEEIKKVRTQSILDALDICLKHCYFSFNDEFYKQEGGVGTGIKFATPYTCLGMGKFEAEVLSQGGSLLDKIILWKRFMVDWLNSIYPGVIVTA